MCANALRAGAAIIGAALVAAACGGSKNPVTPTPVTCTYILSLTAAQAPAAGQAITVHVDTAASCAWTARTQAGWIALSATSGTGPADVVVTLTANDGIAERVGTVTIADKDVSIRQGGRTPNACTYALTSSSSTIGAAGGRGRVSVQTAAGCAWTARVQASWVTLPIASGVGPGEVEYEVAPFDGTAQRETRIEVDQASFTLRQDPPAPAPCTYAVDPTESALHWHGTANDGLDVRITTLAHCSWTATPASTWMQLVTPGAGTGSAAARVRVGAYTNEPTRSAPLMIRWPTDTAGQNVWITQEGCRYAISLTSDTVPPAGGRRRVSVFGTPVTVTCAIGCPWTVAVDVPWIHVAGSTSGAGDDDVFFDVEVNATGAVRTGTITIAGRTLVVTQSR